MTDSSSANSSGGLPSVVAFPSIERSGIHRVTSVDVARCADVSQSTVSLVFSGKGPRPRVRGHGGARAPLRARARLPAERGRADASARSSRAVALLVPDMTNPFSSSRAAWRAARGGRPGYIVILVDTQNDRHWESQSFEALRAGPVDGYLLFEVTAGCTRPTRTS